MHHLDVDVALADLRDRDDVLPYCGVAEARLPAVSVEVNIGNRIVETVICGGEELG